MGTTISLMQFSHTVPINSSFTMTSPNSSPKTAPSIMAEKTCVLSPIFFPAIFIFVIPFPPVFTENDQSQEQFPQP